MTRFRTPMRFFLLTAMVLSASVSGFANAAPRAHRVSGQWQTLVPVTLTSYSPSTGDPTTGQYEGVGSTLWRGTWTGITTYTIRGNANLVTGAGSGSLTETFVGRSVAGGTGTITFTETYTLDSGGHLRIQARIVGATGDFVRAHGVVTFVGTELGVVTGSGTYNGNWNE